ncbi:hypothetical protein FRAAL6685 [Frankia alni ACN14a]|uniref:Uncharacterized protein n=1 Tax=Frankia alni (strain DSM 45986 / CECT 9034 / ACN14a) TaxID=326424 RepID=Q0RB80_FRAAA|nr:hypothetical protein FRAAL6685 [Frankia alni ACN14a]
MTAPVAGPRGDDRHPARPGGPITAAAPFALLGVGRVWNNDLHLCRCRDTPGVRRASVPLGKKEDGWRHVPTA